MNSTSVQKAGAKCARNLFIGRFFLLQTMVTGLNERYFFSVLALRQATSAHNLESTFGDAY